MGRLPLIVKTSTTVALLSGITLAILMQFVTGFRITCPPTRLQVSRLHVCDPELWPFLAYSLYSSPHYAGEELPQLRLVGVLADGGTVELAPEDFLLDTSSAFETVMVAVLDKNVPEVLNYTTVYDGTHNVPVVALRLENNPLVLTDAGFVQSGRHVDESYITVEPEGLASSFQ